MFFWLDLPEELDAMALLPKAVEAGMAFVPGAAFYANAPRANTLRLSFVTVSPEKIEQGVAALGAGAEAGRGRMKHSRFAQVDVFTDTALAGNPLAVVLDGSGLDAATMQRFTDWTNLSEATFLSAADASRGRLPRAHLLPGARAAVRRPPDAGQLPCLARARRPAARREHIVQECGVGLVRIRRDGQRLAFAAPPRRRSGPLDEADVQLIARGLGVPRDEIVAHAWCDNGPRWRGVMLRSAERVLARAARCRGAGRAGARRRRRASAAATMSQFEVRAFFSGHNGLAEDPVTGSLNAALAQWLIGAGLAPPPLRRRAGQALGRAGRVFVRARRRRHLDRRRTA